MRRPKNIKLYEDTWVPNLTNNYTLDLSLMGKPNKLEQKIAQYTQRDPNTYLTNLDAYQGYSGDN